MHERREVEVSARNVRQRARRVRIDAHAHLVLHRRLLDIAADDTVAVLDHAERDLVCLVMGGDRERRAAGPVGTHQVGEVEVGEDVPVHHEKGLVEPLEVAQRPGRPEGLVLPVVRELHALGQVVRVGEVRLDERAEVAHAQVHAPAAVARQLGEDQMQDRPVTDRHERFRQHERVRPQPRAHSAGEDHGTHLLRSLEPRPRGVKPGRMAHSPREGRVSPDLRRQRRCRVRGRGNARCPLRPWA